MDRPILYSAPMILALLAGRKTQTRRFLDAWTDDEPPAYAGYGEVVAYDENDHPYRWPRTHAIGDRLYVREAWRTYKDDDALSGREIVDAAADGGWTPTIQYSDGSLNIPDDQFIPGRYRHARFMPRAFSRITQIVTDVRVQRLQDISWDDAVAEGISRFDPTNLSEDEAGPINRYAALWDAINGRGAWDTNPWIVAYTAETHLCNIDQMGKAS